MTDEKVKKDDYEAIVEANGNLREIVEVFATEIGRLTETLKLVLTILDSPVDPHAKLLGLHLHVGSAYDLCYKPEEVLQEGDDDNGDNNKAADNTG